MDPREHYGARFETFAAELAASDPAWLAARRKDAMSAFSAQGFPTTRMEEWRYTSVAPLARTAFELAPGAPPGLRREHVEAASLPVYACSLYVFVNGRFAPALSARPAPANEVAVRSLASELAERPDRLEPLLARRAPVEGAAFVALNTAFLRDGAFLEIAPGARLAAPVHVVHLAYPDGRETVSHPRALVVAGRDSEATVIEDHVSLGEGTFFTNAVTEIELEAGARLDYVKLQREAPGGYHVSAVQATLGRDARFLSVTLSLGGALTRSDLEARLDGPGADCTLDGLYVAGDRQLVDNHTTIDHLRPHGTSRELYKGILDGRSRGVFRGRVIVRKEAQKTDSRQTNKNLLLSRDAEADSKPQLEISADDVKCSHGSTIGQLEEDALFYLRARGIDEVEARRLLLRAFASEVTQAIREEPVRSEVEALLLARLRLEPSAEAPQ
ncbi:MAG TPA: Fe-S cluster assembly protein SufD [Myxococcota bacterium]|nr:Fe-S cluster assembly protein SufD [Myxococcota bacterium]